MSPACATVVPHDLATALIAVSVGVALAIALMVVGVLVCQWWAERRS